MKNGERKDQSVKRQKEEETEKEETDINRNRRKRRDQVHKGKNEKAQ